MPKPTVAILGASADRAKYGNKSVRAHLAQGYDVFPVNPKGGEIEGLTVYTRLADIPVAHLNRVSAYLQPSVLLGVLDEVAAVGCDEFFLNPGSESSEVVARCEELGIEPIIACSIVDLGTTPAAFGD